MKQKHNDADTMPMVSMTTSIKERKREVYDDVNADNNDDEDAVSQILWTTLGTPMKPTESIKD